MRFYTILTDSENGSDSYDDRFYVLDRFSIKPRTLFQVPTKDPDSQNLGSGKVFHRNSRHIVSVNVLGCSGKK